MSTFPSGLLLGSYVDHSCNPYYILYFLFQDHLYLRVKNIVNEQYFSLTPNQLTVLLIMTYKPNKLKRTGRECPLIGSLKVYKPTRNSGVSIIDRSIWAFLRILSSWWRQAILCCSMGKTTCLETGWTDQMLR